MPRPQTHTMSQSSAGKASEYPLGSNDVKSSVELLFVRAIFLALSDSGAARRFIALVSTIGRVTVHTRLAQANTHNRKSKFNRELQMKRIAYMERR